MIGLTLSALYVTKGTHALRKTTLTDHAANKRATQYLLKNGLISCAEAAKISGRSRQIIHVWAKELDAESARENRLAKLWARALRQAG